MSLRPKLFIDFGSGYNPRKGYKTCDCTSGPMLDFHFDSGNYRFLDVGEGSVDVLRMKNVVHHVPNLFNLFKAVRSALSPSGRLIIEDPNESSYEISYVLDVLWYRGVNSRPEIWISSEYRDITPLLKVMFPVVTKSVGKVYERTVCRIS